MPYLNVIHSNARSFQVSITDEEITIGRGKDNHVSLSDNTVSRHHASILKTGEGYLLTDFGSFNGTLVNDEPVQSIILKDGDRIKIGHVKFSFYTKDNIEPSLSNSVIILPDTEEEKSNQKIIKTNPDESLRADLREFFSSSTEFHPQVWMRPN